MHTQYRGSRKLGPTESTHLIDETEIPEPELKNYRCRKIKFIEPLPVLYIASAVILDPVIQQYVYLRISEEYGNNSTNTSQGSDLCSRNKSSETFKIQQETQHASSQFFAYLTMVQVLLSCLPIIIIGNVIDRIGRKFALYLTLSTRIVHVSLAMAVIGFNLPIYVFYAGAAIDGLSGSISAIMMTFNTYISDVTEPGKQRGFRMTVLEAVLGITSGVCSLVTGYLITNISFLIPVFIALGLIILALLYSIFILAESYVPEDKAGSRENLSFVQIWKKAFAHYIWDTAEKRRSRLLLAIAGLFLTAPAIIASKDVVVLYVLNLPFCWTANHIGTFFAIQTFVRWFVSITVMKLLQRVFSEAGLVIVGNLSNCIAYVMLAFAHSNGMIYLSASLGLFAYIGLPNLRSAMSKLVKQDEQGSLFAGISFIESLSIMIFEIIFNALYSATLPIMPGIVFFLIGGMLLISVGIFIIYEIISRRLQREIEVEKIIN